jgi:hypothetical protein
MCEVAANQHCVVTPSPLKKGFMGGFGVEQMPCGQGHANDKMESVSDSQQSGSPRQPIVFEGSSRRI